MGRWSGRVMGQKGFFDLERRLAAISSKGDPLEAIKKIVRWEDFRADIEAMTGAEPEERKSNAGRKPYDALLKFKIVVLQSLHNLSDEQTEYLIRDRFSFMRFLDLEIEDPVPDATTSCRDRKAEAPPARKRSGASATNSVACLRRRSTSVAPERCSIRTF